MARSEKKHDQISSQKIRATIELADAIRNAIKRYTRHTRKTAWQKVSSTRGREEIEKLMKQPSRSLNRIRALAGFREWLEVSE